MINEVYGGGGNTGAAYTYDFVELYNPTDAAISLSGMSLQYRSGASTAVPGAAGVNTLSGSVAKHGHFLVQLAAGTSVTDKPLPGVDLAVTASPLALSGSGGQIYLVNGTSPVAAQTNSAAPWTFATSVVDFVGWGTSTTVFEGSNRAGATANGTSISRGALGVDSDDNAVDFAPAATPTPEGSASDGGAPAPLALATVPNTKILAGSSVSIQTSASGGSGDVTFALTGTPDTAGLSISSSGQITGKPTTAGTYTITVTATAGAESVAKSFTLTVVAPNRADHVLISEVWGDGGYTDAPFSNDYIELYNPTAAPVNLTGWAIAYRGFTTTKNPVDTYPLTITGSDTIQPGGYYLIQGQADANGGGASLPDPDATVDIDYNTFDYRDGFVALLDTTTAPTLPTGDITASEGTQHIVDALGYGPTNTFEGAKQTAQTSSETAAIRQPVDNDSNDNTLDFVLGDLTPTNSNGVVGDDGKVVLPTTCDSTLPANPAIAQVQGTDAGFSPYINCSVTTTGVVTAIYAKGFDASGKATCGYCGFYIQTPGADSTPGASDAVFVSAGTKFDGKTVPGTGTALAVGDAVQIKGKVGEYGSGETLTQVVVDPTVAGNIAVTTPQAGGVVTRGAAPTTYAAREAHEGELFDPTHVVVTDSYNFESQGELGLAAGAPDPAGPVAKALGDVAEAPLQQPGQICRDGDSTCIQAAQADLKNRGYFLTGGTTYLGTSNIYHPDKAKNSDLPYPFIDKDHSARVGADVTFPQGAILDFRNKKWYLEPPRSVVATCANTTAPHGTCTPDLGADVVTFEDTRAQNLTPVTAPAGSNIRFATYNVENFFSVTMNEFAAKNPLYTCEYDNDRTGAGLLSYQCTNPAGMATAWDPVTGAVTAYSSSLANAPRGAGRTQDLERQTSKIVTAINRLGADVVALEEIGNPNKLKLGVTNDPLHPDLSNKKDQGQGTAIQWRDETVAYLVDHLNAKLAPSDDQWAFAASPEETTDATSVPGMCTTVQPNGTPVPGPANLAGTCSYASGQDVIRSAFIYKKAKVVPVGQGDLDLPGYSVNGTPDPWGNHVFTDVDGKPTSSPFDSAREPFAQYFKPVGAKNDEGFALIVNHYKSKGDAAAPAGPAKGGDKNDPLHGAFNATRVAQSKELIRFANAFAHKWNTDKVFLLGDFNAYSGEDPVTTIEDADDTVDPLDFKEIHSDDKSDTSYVFSTKVNGIGYGGAGSLDHIFASAGARATSPHTDIWEINANEPDVYDYGRYNTNATDFFDGNAPWRGSDHNPEVIDLTLPSASAAKQVTDVQILGINDFHGRLIADASDGGAAPLAGAVASLRGIYGADETVLASAGDNVGASIFESFTQHDKPTLDALNEMDLQVSSVGNHEFDHGVNDLLNRIEKPYDADTNKYGADEALTWGDYLAANVVWNDSSNGHTAGDPISAPTRMIEVPNSLSGTPIKIGFVGAVTSDLPSLQSPENLAGVTVLNNADTIAKVNDYAADLKVKGADLVILLDHEGAATTDCSTMKSAGTAFSSIVNGVDDDVDAILSGHTHLEYSCTFPKKATASNPLTVRPVMQGASYGTALDQLVYSFDASNKPVDLIANNVGVKGPSGALFNYGADPDVQPIVDKAVADSAVAGAQVLGTMTAPMYRSKLSDGTDNRGGESTLGNQVAETQRWATAGVQQGGAQIAFMNPGGLRADAEGTKNGDAYDLTYREAADVQPFANELVNMRLTGDQIKTVLQEQWQRDAKGNIPARPFLKLGISKGFTYTYAEQQDPAKPAGAMLGTVTGMWLDGTPIDPDATYSVTVNSFLATGGDNFWELNNGTEKLDTEQTDLQGQVDYMKQYGTTPLQVDSSQRGIKVTLPGDAPASYKPGDAVLLRLGSLDMNGGSDADKPVQDSTVSIKVGDEVVAADIPVTHGNSTTPDDHWGTTDQISFVVPASAVAGDTVRVVGAATGTDAILPLALDLPKRASTVTAAAQTLTYGASGALVASVAAANGSEVPTGTITFREGSAVIGAAPVNGSGVATLAISEVTLGAGVPHAITAVYSGDAAFDGDTKTFDLTVTQGAPTVAASSVTVTQGTSATFPVTVSSSATAKPTGTVTIMEGSSQLASGTLTNSAVTIAVATGALSVGAHTLTITYGGDDNFATAGVGVTLTVDASGTGGGGGDTGGSTTPTPTPTPPPTPTPTPTTTPTPTPGNGHGHPPTDTPPVVVNLPSVPAHPTKPIVIHVEVNGEPVTGKVVVKVGDRQVTVQAVNGTVRLSAGKIRRLLGDRHGKVKAKIHLVGSAKTTSFTFTVKGHRHH